MLYQSEDKLFKCDLLLCRVMYFINFLDQIRSDLEECKKRLVNNKTTIQSGSEYYYQIDQKRLAATHRAVINYYYKNSSKRMIQVL